MASLHPFPDRRSPLSPPLVLRKLLFWCHLVTGVTVGAIVLVMSVTGVLLTYQRQVTAWADVRGIDGGPGAAPSAGAARRLTADSLLARVMRGQHGTPTAITWRSTTDAPVAIAFGRERTVFANAYTGVVLGEGSARTRAFFRLVTDWHRWLAGTGERRATGKAITGAANLGFLFIVVSGAILWWPRNWSRAAVRNVALFRRGLSGKARDFNWHNVIGLWSAIPLFLVVLSGVVISYPWASALVYRAVGETPPPPAAPAASARAPRERAPATAVAAPALEPLVDIARHKVPGWTSISLALPRGDTSRVTFTIDTGTGGQPQARAQYTLDRRTGAALRWEPFSAGSPGRRLRSILRFTHTGEVLGIAGQTIAGLVSLGAVLLVWTGLWLSWRRLGAWRVRGRLAIDEAIRTPSSTARRR